MPDDNKDRVDQPNRPDGFVHAGRLADTPEYENVSSKMKQIGARIEAEFPGCSFLFQLYVAPGVDDVALEKMKEETFAKAANAGVDLNPEDFHPILVGGNLTTIDDQGLGAMANTALAVFRDTFAQRTKQQIGKILRDIRPAGSA